MRLSPFRTILLAFVCLTPAALASGQQIVSSPKTVSAGDGRTFVVEAGTLQVPESRRRPTARRVTIPYYRLKSESGTPGSPVFLLAGGPGSSWIDQLQNDENAREVAFYRTVADVVLFDQRGAGHALPKMTCPDTAELAGADKPLDLADVRRAMRGLVVTCRDHWQKEGADLAAYNTVENAADINDLRQALGYRKVTLVGGSYGSHLALQFMRQYPNAVDRAVIFGVEGPDHTWDNPSAMLATLRRIAEATEQSPVFAGRIPPDGLLKTFDRVLQRLDASPETVLVTVGAQSKKVLVDAARARQMLRANAGRRNAANIWPEMILAMDRGDYSAVARAALNNRQLQLPDPMHFSVDCASGVSEERRQEFRNDPARSLLGDINFEYESLCDLWPSEDLGESFHADVVSDIPTLLIQGTWDMSTPIENAREVAASLTNGQLIEVVGGNHGALYNLYERWAPMRPMLAEFLAGHHVDFPKTVDDMAEIRFQAPSKR